MEGEMIDQWIEKLLPMFTGEYSLGEMTKGLPDPHRDRVFEIAGVLLKNGFVRDVSQDRPHRLAAEILQKYASQIQFLDSVGDSGAYRFQTYRQTKVLAVGSGSFFVSLVCALLESGVPKIHVGITDSAQTNRERLTELAAHARQTDAEVSVQPIPTLQEGEHAWRDIIEAFDAVLYVSETGEVAELRELHTACKEKQKLFLPAICVEQVGLAGPLVHTDAEGCWESVWRRIHKEALEPAEVTETLTVDDAAEMHGAAEATGELKTTEAIESTEQPHKDLRSHLFSSTAGAMLANVIVFELLKTVAGVSSPEQINQFFLLNLETLEGKWHSFIPHPLVTEQAGIEWIQDIEPRLEQSTEKAEWNKLLLYFSQLTSAEAGIFHVWEEGDLKQLPLSQCRVQAVDPLSEGPAELLPPIVCTALTHEEARREAGLAGIEAYGSRLVDLIVSTLPQHPNRSEAQSVEIVHRSVGVGTGESFAECVCRGLQKWLNQELARQVDAQTILPENFGHIKGRYASSRIEPEEIEDERSRFYVQALTTMRGTPFIVHGEHLNGFPVVWVDTDGRRYGSAGLNRTLALRNALQQALRDAQNQLTDPPVPQAVDVVPDEDLAEVLQSALDVLKQNRKRLLVFEVTLEPVLKHGMAGVFGVAVQEEGMR
jgi:hypothetical protein